MSAVTEKGLTDAVRRSFQQRRSAAIAGTFYHGTYLSDALQIQKGGFRLNQARGRGAFLGAGVYVSGNKDWARGYARDVQVGDFDNGRPQDAAILHLRINPSKPLSADAAQWPDWFREAYTTQTGKDPDDYIKNRDFRTVARLAQRHGFDAIMYEKGTSVVYDPSKVKVIKVEPMPASEVRMAGVKKADTNLSTQFQEKLTQFKDKLAYNKARGLGDTSDLWVAWRFFYQVGQQWSAYVISNLSIPPKKAKGVEMAARVFTVRYGRGKNPRPNIAGWFDKHSKRFELLATATGWQQRQEGDGVFQHQGFRVHNTIGASDKQLQKVKAVIDQALKGVQKAGVPGLKQACYGDIYLVGRIERKNWAAWYYPSKDVIYLRPNIRGSSEQDIARTLIHEICHRLWRSSVDKNTKRMWNQYHIKLSMQGKAPKELPPVGTVLPDILKINNKVVVVDKYDDGNVWFNDAKKGKPVGGVSTLTFRDWLKEVDRAGKFPSVYATTDAEEHFCEAVSHKGMGSLAPENLAALDAIILGRGDASRYRVASERIAAAWLRRAFDTSVEWGGSGRNLWFDVQSETLPSRRQWPPPKRLMAEVERIAKDHSYAFSANTSAADKMWRGVRAIERLHKRNQQRRAALLVPQADRLAVKYLRRTVGMDKTAISFKQASAYVSLVEKRVAEVSANTNRALRVFAESSAKGGTIKIIEGRSTVGHVSAASMDLRGEALTEFFMAQAQAGIPRPTRGRRRLVANYGQEQCGKDFHALQQKYSSVTGMWFVGGSHLDSDLRGTGLGKVMYAAIVMQAAGHGCAVSPDVCKGERTSPDAYRVWRSLIRHFPSVGFVVWGGAGIKGRLAAAKYKDKKQVPKADGKGTTTVYEYSEKQVQHRNREKAKRVEALRKSIDKLRTQVKKDLKSEDPKTRLTALAVGLMDATYERVGNDESAKSGHYGITGWLVKHVSFGKGSATISYVGKSGVKQEKVVDDSTLVSALKEATKGKSSDKLLCESEDCKVKASDVNSYLKDFNITAKDIRGLHANSEMQKRLKEVRSKGGTLPSDKKEREQKLKEEFKEALEGAAEAVGHEPSTLKSQYLVPGLADNFLSKGEVMTRFDKKASQSIGQAHNSIGGEPWQKVRLPGWGLLWTEPHDSDDAFAPMIASWQMVDGWVIYKGRNGSEGIVVGSKADLIKWDKDIQLHQSMTPDTKPVPWDAATHGGEKFVRQAISAAQGVLKALGVSAKIEVLAHDRHRMEGSATGSTLTLINVHRPPQMVSYIGGIRLPAHMQVAAHEAAHLGYTKGGRAVMELLKERKGEALSVYHSLAGHFEGAMEAAALYALVPRKLQKVAPDVHAAVQKWFKGKAVRVARSQPLTPDVVAKLRKDWLKLSKNVDRVRNLKEIETFVKGSRRWWDYLGDMFVQIRKDLQGRIRMADAKRETPLWREDGEGIAWEANKGAAQWYLDNMDPIWNFRFVLVDLPRTPDPGKAQTEDGVREALRKHDYSDREIDTFLIRNPPTPQSQLDQEAVEKWRRQAKRWFVRSRKKAPAAWKWLNDYFHWTTRQDSHGGGGDAFKWNTREKTVQNIDGFQIQLDGYLGTADHDEYIEKFRAGLAYYKRKAAKVYPWLLRNQLPIVLLFDKDMHNAAATYNWDHITAGFWTMASKPPRVANIIAHEMGHHIYKTVLNRKHREFWENAIKGDFGPLDLREVLSKMKPGEKLGPFGRRMEKEDPVLSLQVDALQYMPYYRDKVETGMWGIQALVDQGVTSVDVPKHPITAYGAKNPEEAFCETLGNLVGYGPRTVLTEVKKWFWHLQPNVRMGARSTPAHVYQARMGSLAPELERRFNQLVAEWEALAASGEEDSAPYKDKGLEFGNWFTDTFRVEMNRTPPGGKDAKKAAEAFLWSVRFRLGQSASRRKGIEQVKARWEQFKPHIPTLVQKFSDEGGTVVLRQIKTSNATFINAKGLATSTFKKYVKYIDGTFSSLRGWRRKALAGDLKVVLAGPDKFRGTAAGSYKQESDTLLVRATPNILKRPPATYGSVGYILVHELGHRYERKVGVGRSFDGPQWITTRYSQSTGGFSGLSESFAELFALGHFGITKTRKEFGATVQRFENLMSGKEAA